MPIIPSTYKAPFYLGGHFQTIFPSVLMKEKPVSYQREQFFLADGDYLYLDWAKCNESPSRELMIICHGLCGYTTRHYCLSVVHAFHKIGMDCLAWNYRGTGQVENASLTITCNNSTDDLDQVVRHAIQQGYQKIYLCGFSMGANLVALYLGREADHLPDEVLGGVGVCGTIDSSASIRNSHVKLFGFYEWYFLRKLKKRATERAQKFPEFSIEKALKAKTFHEFDSAYTARIMGFQDAEDYYVTSSASNHLKTIRRPTLLIQPQNDPMLARLCFPIQEAEENPMLFLEMPKNGGHCGFISPKGQEWWPAARIRQFVLDTIRPQAGLEPLAQFASLQ